VSYPVRVLSDRELVVGVIIRPRERKIKAYWRCFPSDRGDELIITLNLKLYFPTILLIA